MEEETIDHGASSVEDDCGEDFTKIDIDFADHSSADALLANELYHLSVEERDMINEEIHGIRHQCQNETPELLQNSLKQLAVELICLPSKQAYDASQAFPECYINTDDFRLIFLRCEFFDAHKAAVRMTKYLDLIHWAFGEKVLQRDVCIADLDEQTLKLLRAGPFQVLPGMDRTGRRVVGNFAAQIDPDQPRINRIRASIYCLVRLARDNVSIQRKGLVALFWTHNFRFDDLKDRAFVHTKMFPGVPIRFSAIHCCIPETNHLSRMALVMHNLAIGAENRKRLRFHIGSATECLYKLQTFGIQSIQLPINTNTGKIKTANHRKWLDLQQKKEDAAMANKTFKGIECPEQRDILFGRGWPKMNHPGNAIFRSTIESRLDEYNMAESKGDKTMIAWSIVCELRDFGARFLREDTSGCWMEVSNEVARQKVSIGFRDIRKARQKSSSNSDHGKGNPSMAQDRNRNTLPRSVGSSSYNVPLVPVLPAASSKRKVPGRDSPDEDKLHAVFLNMDGSKRQRPPCGPFGKNHKYY